MSYKNLRPLPNPQSQPEGEIIGLAGGFYSHMTPKEGALDQSPGLNAVRFQGRSVRQDFGFRRVGEPALSTVLGLLEHKFLRFNSTFQRLVRMTRTQESTLHLGVWDGEAWASVGSTVERLENVMISAISIQGVLLMADGKTIFIWEETFEIGVGDQDFSPANSAGYGDSVSVVVNPGQALNGEYKINYGLTFPLEFEEGLRVTVELLLNGGVVGTMVVLSDPGGPHTKENLSFDLVREINSGDVITLRIADVESAGPVSREVVLLGTSSGEGMERIAERGSVDSNTTYRANAALLFQGPSLITLITGEAKTLQVTIRVRTGAGNFIMASFPVTRNVGQSNMMSIPETVFERNGMLATDEFEILVNKITESADPYFVDGSAKVAWEFDRELEPGDAGVLLHGYNLLDDYDPASGVQYEIPGTPISVLEPLSPDAPGARFIFEFADRVIALRDDGDTQSLAWSVSGDVRDWTGPGSGQIFLVSSQDDPIDDLMAGTGLGSNIAIVLRKRSIWRAFPTGNVQQAIGVIPWLLGIGTESPFSLKNVERGAIFLGHNLMVYFISEQGLLPIGTPIHQELIRTLTSNLEVVDATWDPVFNEYILGVPENNSAGIKKLWYFDVRRFLDNQELVWRSRELEVQRLAVAGTL